MTLHDQGFLADICDDDAVVTDERAQRPLPPFPPVPWWRVEGSRILGRIGRKVIEEVHIGANRRRTPVPIVEREMPQSLVRAIAALWSDILLSDLERTPPETPLYNGTCSDYSIGRP